MANTLEEKVKGRKTCNDINEMARFISKVLGSNQHFIDEDDQYFNDEKIGYYNRFTQNYYRDEYRYKTKVFDILNEEPGSVTVRYKGRIVFSDNGCRAYRRFGEWEEQFKRLHLRAKIELEK